MNRFVPPRRPRVAVSHRAIRSAGFVAAALVAAACTPAGAQDVVESEAGRFRVVTMATGLVNPWGLAFLPGGDILVTERPGRVRLVRGGALQTEPVGGGPEVAAAGQGGLLDIELHPRFAENRMVYMTYSKGGAEGKTTALARARYENGQLSGLEDVFVADAWSTRNQHYGSRIVFDSTGMMFISVGERNEKTPAQDVSNHKGTILRLHDDGRVPSDNPFVGRDGAKPEIYSYGHRNPQGMTLNPATGQVWASEHGARGGDEINVVRPGRNYGWPAITHGVDYNGTPISPDSAREGMEQPLLHWTPSIAPSGLTIYTGDKFPGWKGNVFAGALAGQQLRRVVVDGERATHQETLLQGRGRVRAVKTGPDGFIYLLIDDRNGSLLRLEPVQ